MMILMIVIVMMMIIPLNTSVTFPLFYRASRYSWTIKMDKDLKNKQSAIDRMKKNIYHI